MKLKERIRMSNVVDIIMDEPIYADESLKDKFVKTYRFAYRRAISRSKLKVKKRLQALFDSSFEDEKEMIKFLFAEDKEVEQK